MKDVIIRADIPNAQEDRKDLVTNGLETGISKFIFRKGDESFENLGKMDAFYTDAGKFCNKDFEFCMIDTPDAQEYALSLAGKREMVIVDTSDWTIIPLENMIAKFRKTSTKILAIARTKEEAELYLTTMENGVDGIVIEVDDPSKISVFRDLCMDSSAVELCEIEVTSVRPVEMGDRVCIDTCTMMIPGEGMLIGSYSNCLFLVQSESEENGYVASRPFRVNAGAVHAYIQVPGDKTRYVAEIGGGDPVVVCDRFGKTRIATTGRSKIEIRPLLIIEATDGKRTYSVILQNAETVKLVTKDGSASVSSLKAGDKVLAKLEDGGRHFGMAVEETITER